MLLQFGNKNDLSNRGNKYEYWTKIQNKYNWLLKERVY